MHLGVNVNMALHRRFSRRFALAAALASVALAATALPPGTEDEIFERIKPIGQLSAPAMAVEGEAVVDAGPRSGETVYNSYCTACHAPAVAGAIGSPAYGDADAWSPRIAKGIDALYQSTYNGLNGVMPARGTCMDCSDEELQATVDYMVEAAGG